MNMPGLENMSFGQWLGHSAGSLLLPGSTQSASDLAAQNFSESQARLEREFNAEQAEIARDYNSLEAEKQRDFEREMSNTAYSRAVADAKSVGINPYALGIGGTSTPSVSLPHSAQATSSSGARGVNAFQGEMLSTALKVVAMIVTKGMAANSVAKSTTNRVRAGFY